MIKKLQTVFIDSALIAISYAIWWVIVDKRRLSQILLFGSFIAIQRVVMDIFGTNTGRWSYDIRETPLLTSPFLHDFTLTPLALMVVYQYCHSWKKFLVWSGVATGIISFVFLPILTMLGFLKLYNWNYLYSFGMIFGLALFSRWVIVGVLSIQQKDESRTLNHQPARKPLDKKSDTREPEAAGVAPIEEPTAPQPTAK